MENEKTIEREEPSAQEILQTLAHGFDRLELGQQEIKDSLGVVQSDVGMLKSDVAGLKDDVHRLEAKTDRIEAKLDETRIKLGGKIDDVAETLAESVADHETRITAVEAK